MFSSRSSGVSSSNSSPLTHENRLRWPASGSGSWRARSAGPLRPGSRAWARARGAACPGPATSHPTWSRAKPVCCPTMPLHGPGLGLTGLGELDDTAAEPVIGARAHVREARPPPRVARHRVERQPLGERLLEAHGGARGDLAGAHLAVRHVHGDVVLDVLVGLAREDSEEQELGPGPLHEARFDSASHGLVAVVEAIDARGLDPALGVGGLDVDGIVVPRAIQEAIGPDDEPGGLVEVPRRPPSAGACRRSPSS